MNIFRTSLGAVSTFVIVSAALGALASCGLYADPPGGSIRVENECSTVLSVWISQRDEPSVNDPEPFTIGSGEHASVGGTVASGTYYVLAAGPGGEEFRVRKMFDRDGPDVVAVISGPDCPA